MWTRRRPRRSREQTPTQPAALLAPQIGPETDTLTLVAQATAGNPDAKAELAKRAWEIVQSPDVSTETLAAVVSVSHRRREWDRTHRAIAVHPAADSAVLIALMKVCTELVLNTLSDSPDTPSDVLALIAQHTRYSPALWGVAENSNTPLSALSDLSHHEDPSIRSRAAANPHLPAEDWEWLLRDPEGEVRAAAAHNPRTTPDLLEALAGDPSFRVRRQVAWDPRTPVPVLNRLAKLEIWRMDSLDRADDNFQRQHATHRAVLTAALESPRISADILRQLAEEPFRGYAVEEAVAGNPNTPADILRKYASGYRYPYGGPGVTMDRSGGDVLEALAANPSLPVDCIDLLPEDLRPVADDTSGQRFNQTS